MADMSEMERILRGVYPHSARVPESTDTGEVARWFTAKGLRCASAIGPPDSGDFCFWSFKEYLFRDEVMAVEFKLRFG